MKHNYRVYFAFVDVDPIRDIRRLVAKFPSLHLERRVVRTEHEDSARALYKAAQTGGFKCSLEISTLYDKIDALSGKLGCLGLGPSNTNQFRAVFPKDAFDFSGACPHCGLGAVQIKPHLLSQRSIRCPANFYYGAEGTSIPLMRTEIAQEIMDATGDAHCMRHPVTRAGKVVREWMEAVPTMTMPPLSKKSEGVLLGSTSSCSDIGEPPEIVDPCPECGRNTWDYDYEQHTRLVYPRAAVKKAQEHGVVAMYEPKAYFPGFDAKQQQFKSLYGLPRLLFTRPAIEVLVKYTRSEPIRDSSYIEPIFST